MQLKPEFLNRIDEIVMFEPLSKSDIEKIVDLQMKKDFLSLVEGLETYCINDAQLYLKGLCPVCKNKK